MAFCSKLKAHAWYHARYGELVSAIFFLSYFAPVIIRLAIAAVFLYDALRVWKSGTRIRERMIAIGWLVLGLAVGAGFLTQLAALVAFGHIILIVALFKDTASVFKNNVVAFLALAILIFLLVAGPGGFALDLPY